MKGEWDVVESSPPVNAVNDQWAVVDDVPMAETVPQEPNPLPVNVNSNNAAAINGLSLKPVPRELTIGSVVSKAASQIPSLYRASVGGQAQALGESFEGPKGLDVESLRAKDVTEDDDPFEEAYAQVNQNRAANGLSPVDPASVSGPELIRDAGLKTFVAGIQEAQKRAPVIPEGHAGLQFVADVTTASGLMVPALLMGAVTRNPNAGLAMMFPQVYGHEYGSKRHEGLTPDQSALEGMVVATSEILTEKTPLGILLKPGSKPLAKILKSAGAEGLQETLQGGLEELVNAGILRPEMTAGEAFAVFKDPATWKRMGYQGLVGAGMGGTLATAAVAVEGGINLAAGRKADDKQRPEAAGLTGAGPVPETGPTIDPGVPFEPQATKGPWEVVDMAPAQVEQFQPGDPGIEFEVMMGGKSNFRVETDQEAINRIRNTRLPENLQDPRLHREPYRAALESMAADLVKGGGIALVPDTNYQMGESDKPGERPMVRTKSLNPDWFQSLGEQAETKVSVEQLRNAVTKTLEGRKLGVREARVIDTMLNVIHGERTSREHIDYAKESRDFFRSVYGKLATEQDIGDLGKELDRHAGFLYEEQEYPIDMDSAGRVFTDLVHEARALGGKNDTIISILESQASDEIVAGNILSYIKELQNGQTTQESPGTAGNERIEAAGLGSVQTEPVEESRAKTSRPALELAQVTQPATQAGKSAGAQPDLFGGKSDTQQAIHDQKQARARAEAGAPPVESGDGALFDGSAKQVDIEDAQSKTDRRGHGRQEATERREDAGKRKALDQMTPAEKDAEIERLRLENEATRYTSPVTDMPNYQAFKRDRDLGWKQIVYFDLDDFKTTNDTLGHAIADELLKKVGQYFHAQAGSGRRFYHRSGDEYLGRFRDMGDAEMVMKAAQEHLFNTPYTLVFDEESTGATVKIIGKGVGLSYGIGTSEQAAEEQTSVDKQRRKLAGQRSGKRDADAVSGAESEGTGAQAPVDEVQPPGTETLTAKSSDTTETPAKAGVSDSGKQKKLKQHELPEHHNNLWTVGGMPGEDHRAQEIGKFLGYTRETGEDMVRLQFPDGKIELFTPHQLFPYRQEAESDTESEDEDFVSIAEIQNDKKFKQAVKDFGSPDKTSPVYRDFAQGYLDGLARSEPDGEHFKHVDNVTSKGINPVQSYVSGYLSGLTGKTERIRATELAKAAGRIGEIIENGKTPESNSAQSDLFADVDSAAHEAATSPANNTPQPTDAQKEAGNYKKGHVSIHGLDITIENPQGSERSGTDKGGKKWSIEMQHHYGYIKGTVGRDKDHIDVFLGPDIENADAPVFVIDQAKPDGTGFDEHKVMMGFLDETAAKDGYLSNYEKGWKGLGAMTEMTVDQFKDWLANGDTTMKASKHKLATVQPKGMPLTPELALKLRTLSKVTENARQGIRKHDPKPTANGEYVHVSRANATTRNARADMAAELWRQKRKEFGQVLRDVAQKGYEIPKEYIELAGSSFEYDESGKYSPVKPDADASQSEPDVDQMIREAENKGVVLSEHDKTAIRESFNKAEELYRKARRHGNADPMNKGNAFPMGVGYTKMTKRKERAIDTSVRKAGEASKIYAKGEMAEKYAKGLLSGKGTEADLAAKQASKQESKKRIVEKLINWKKGDTIGKFTIERVNKDRDGYPASYTISGDGVIKGVWDKVDVVKEMFDGDKEEFRSLVDEVRSKNEAQPVDNDKWEHAVGEKYVGAIEAAVEEANARKDGYEYRAGNDAVLERRLIDKAKVSTEKEEHTPTNKQEPTKDHFSRHESIVKRMRDGNLSLDEYHAAFKSLIDARTEVVDELGKEKKDTLLSRMTRVGAYRNKSDNKASIVQSLYVEMIEDFLGPQNTGSGISFMIGGGVDYVDSVIKGVKAKVDTVTEDDLKAYASRVAEARKERAEARKQAEAGIENPETLEDFGRMMTAKVKEMGEGTTFNDIRMSLTQEQREKYDDLSATKSRAERAARKEANQESRIRTPGEEVHTTEIIKTKHTKHGHDLWQFNFEERVSREEFKSLVEQARILGGNYSSYRGGGAIPGWQFRTEESAKAFKALVAGDSEQAREISKARRDAFADDRSQSAVERLTEMADRLEERADEKLNADRKTNTHRRASMAARAEANANQDKAIAQTMRKIADAIESGSTKYLDRVRTKAQVEMLDGMVGLAKYDQLAKKYSTYSEQEKHKYDDPDKETADYVRWPYYTAYRSDLARLGRQALETEGMKLIGQKIMKVADDVTKAYLDFAKKNHLQVSSFSKQGGERAVFKSKAHAEEAIRRSGFRGQAIVLPFKRGENIIIMSPSEAQKRGIWRGDDDKLITLAPDFMEKLIGKARKAHRLEVPWQFESVHEKRTRLSSMGIETPAELRAALREYIALRSAPVKPSKIKEMERAMIGRQKDGLDFFPTPETTADEMVEVSGISEGMSVLEPSAGMGHIAERIRAAGVDPDVVEFSAARRELLEAKGFNVVGNDFMDLKDVAYDRIIMNPPFSDRRDAEHIRHAYDLLKPGGRLVSIVGEGVFFGKDKKATEFREWLDSVNGTEEKLPDGTFNDPNLPVNTSVNARMVVIDKPESAPTFSRTDKPAKGGFSVSDVEEIIAPNILNWGSAAPMVQVVANKSELPGYILDAAGQEGFNGVYDSKTGTVYLVANHIHSRGQARRVLAHEAIGHYSMEELLGDGFEDLLHKVQWLKKSGDTKVSQIAQEVHIRYPGIDEQTESKEIIAVMAEKGIRNDLMKRILAAIRKFLRKLGFDLPFSETELEAMIVKAGRRLRTDSDNPKVRRHVLTDTFSHPESTYYSAMTRFLGEKLPKQAHSSTIAHDVQVFAKKGQFKQEELDWSGLIDWLNEQDRKVTKAEVLQYLSDNQVQVEEIHLGKPNYTVEDIPEGHDVMWDSPGYYIEEANGVIVTGHYSSEEEAIAALVAPDKASTQYAKYTLPGAENYHELLLTLPKFAAPAKGAWLATNPTTGESTNIYQFGDLREYRERGWKITDDSDAEVPAYQAQHFKGTPNLLAHIRFNERTDADGKRILFIEEVQSDWHQQGRKKGYASNDRAMVDAALKEYEELMQRMSHVGLGSMTEIDRARIEELRPVVRGQGHATSMVPDAPFKTTWPLLAMKRMIRYAAENGFDRIAWTTGEQQVERYDLSKQLEHVSVIKNRDGAYDIGGKTTEIGSEEEPIAIDISEKDLPGYIGKELAEKAIHDLKSKSLVEYSGLDLKVGGEGMKAFYDKMLPSMVNKYVKKWGAKVGETTFFHKLDEKGRDFEAHAIDITDAMRESALQGQPLFSRDNEPDKYVVEYTPALEKAQTEIADDLSKLTADNEKNQKGIREKIMGWVDRIEPLSTLDGREQYLADRYLALGSIAKYRELAESIHDTFRKADKEQAKAIYFYLTDKDASASIIGDKTLEAAAKVAKNEIIGIGKLLAHYGVISEETMERHKGEYLPRVYLHYLLGDRAMAAIGTGRKLSNMGYSKARKEIPEEVREIILGEVKDPAYLAARAISVPMRDIAIMNWLGKISTNEQWVLPNQMVDWDPDGTGEPRMVTPFWLKSQADFLRNQARYYEPAQQKKALSLAAQMDEAANEVLDTLGDKVPNKYAQIPNSPRYGAVRGLIIREEIYDDIVGAAHIQSDHMGAAERILGYGGVGTKITQLWKWPLALDTPLPTPTGWTTMGDIQVGDQLFDERGRVCEVLEVKEVLHDRECFEVAFSDGTKIVADKEHRWLVLNSARDENILTTEQIKDTLTTGPRGDKRHSIPVTEALLLPDVDLPIPPYALGVWLGDGSAGSARVCAGKQDADEIIQHLECSGVKCSQGTTRKDGLRVFSIQKVSTNCLRNHDQSEARPNGKGCKACERERKRSELSPTINQAIPAQMRDMGILNEKHIPVIYLRASKEQRMDLLRGLMDTDGWADKNRCAFGTSNPRLRDDVVELLRSLGYKPAVLEHQPVNTATGKHGKTAWKIQYAAYADLPVFHLKRKRDRLAQAPKTRQRSRTRQIVAVTPVPSVPVRCIGVSSPSELFLSGSGFIPTHNSKVAANPPAQVRNFLSNMILLQLSGVPFRKIPTLMVRAIKQIKNKGKYYQVGRKYGVTESTFSNQEIARLEKDLIQLELDSKKTVSLAHLKMIAATVMNATGDIYQMFEVLGKTMKIMHEIESNKATEQQAALEAQKWLFDYSLVGRNTRYLRNAPVGAPFLTFYMKVLPRLIDTAINHPLRYAPYVALMMGMPMLIAAMYGVDDDDVKALKKALPTWLQERGHAMLMPWKDDQGRWMAVDIGYFLPWSMWTDMAVDLGEGNFKQALIGSGLLGGPVPDMISAIKTNKDSFTGREIIDPRDPPQYQLASMMTYIYGMAMPTWLVGAPIFGADPTMRGFTGHMYDAVTGHVNKYGDPRSTYGQAAGRLVGINAYPIEPVLSRALNIKYMVYEINDVKTRMRQRVRDRNLSAEQREKMIQDYRAKIEKMTEDLSKYAEESNINPKLLQ